MDHENISDKRFEKLPWTEKYRPSKIDDIYLPPIIKNKIVNIIKEKNMPNLILVGPPGIGKSSAIKIIAKELYGKYYNDAVLELGLLDDRGIKFMQNDIQNFCKTKISYYKKDEDIYPKYKLIIFDEADNVISRVQDQIGIIMENFSNQIRFAFTCNDSAEIGESVQTKCLIWKYSYLSQDLVIERLKGICKKEKVEYTDSSLKKISDLSGGDLRAAINKLELVYHKYENIQDDYVRKLCNSPQDIIIKNLFNCIINKKLKESLEITFDLRKKSYSGSDITIGMLTTIRSEICKDIPEDIKIKLCDKICNGIYRISNITDSDLQLAGCIVDMIKSLDNYTIFGEKWDTLRKANISHNK
jgi:DNA polymerase III delta prime subunit